MDISKINSCIRIDKISNLTCIIRNSIFNIIKIDKENKSFVINLNSNVKSYIESDLDDVFCITYDYKICNNNFQSSGCNTINLTFPIIELSKLINESI